MLGLEKCDPSFLFQWEASLAAFWTIVSEKSPVEAVPNKGNYSSPSEMYESMYYSLQVFMRQQRFNLAMDSKMEKAALYHCTNLFSDFETNQM